MTKEQKEINYQVQKLEIEIDKLIKQAGKQKTTEQFLQVKRQINEMLIKKSILLKDNNARQAAWYGYHKINT